MAKASGETLVKRMKQRSSGKAEKTMGERIRLRRVEIGMSQSDLAAKLGVTFQQVQKYEKGVNRVSASRITTIAEALDVPVTFFYDNVGKGSDEVNSLLNMDSHFSMRLLRAYTSIKSTETRRSFVTLMEKMAEAQQ